MNLDSIRFSLNVINFMLFFLAGRSVVHIGHLFKGCCGSDECKLKMTLRNQKCNETHAGKQINLLWKKNSVEWIERAQSSGKESDYMIWIQLCVACMINRAPLNHLSLNLISVCVRGVWKWHTNLLQKWQNMVHASIGSDCSVRQQQTMKVPRDCWSTFASVHGNDDKLIECVKQVSLHVAINFLRKNLNEWVAASRRLATPRRTMCDSLKYFRRFWFIGHGACGIYQCKQCMRTMPISWYSISASFRLNQNHLRFFFRFGFNLRHQKCRYKYSLVASRCGTPSENDRQLKMQHWSIRVWRNYNVCSLPSWSHAAAAGQCSDTFQFFGGKKQSRVVAMQMNENFSFCVWSLITIIIMKRQPIGMVVCVRAFG